MKTLDTLKNIGLTVLAVAAIAGIVTFAALHNNPNPVDAHGPDPDSPPVLAGQLDPATPVFPVVPDVVPSTLGVKLTTAEKLEKDMRVVFSKNGFDNNAVVCEHAKGNTTASVEAMLLSTAEASYDAVKYPVKEWMDVTSLELRAYAEVAVCAGSAAKSRVTGVAFN